MRPGLRRLSPPGPPTGARQREEGSPGAAGWELARRDAERRARRTAGRGRGLHGPGRRALPPLPRARRPPPGPRARLGLTAGDPPSPSARRPPAPAAPPPRPRTCSFLLYLWRSHLWVLAAQLAVSDVLPSHFLPLSPPPPPPLGGLSPHPREMKSPLTDPCVNRCHLIGPQAIPGFQPPPGRDTRGGGDGTWARSWETALLREPLGRGFLPWHSPKPQPSPPAPTRVSPTLEDFAKEGRLRVKSGGVEPLMLTLARDRLAPALWKALNGFSEVSFPTPGEMAQKSSLSKAFEGHSPAPGCGRLSDAAPEKSVRKQVLSSACLGAACFPCQLRRTRVAQRSWEIWPHLG